jgi:PhnB protein
MFWGARYGVLTDPFGHCWSVATQVRDLTPEQIQQNMATQFCQEFAQSA